MFEKKVPYEVLEKVLTPLAGDVEALQKQIKELTDKFNLFRETEHSIDVCVSKCVTLLDERVVVLESKGKKNTKKGGKK